MTTISAPPTDHLRLDADLATLHARKLDWARLPIRRKIELLDGLRDRAAGAAERWVELALDAKGLPPGSPYRGEEWAAGPLGFLYYLKRLRRTLEHVAEGTLAALVEGKVRQRPDGTVIVRVVPADLYDRLFFSGVQMEEWMQADVTPGDLPLTMAPFCRQAEPLGGVSLVLGAGNVAMLSPSDALYRLYAEGQVCLLKMNPVNSYLGPIFQEVFSEYVEAGYLRIAYGGAEIGEHLTRHPRVDSIHVTGSSATHDAIVYGSGEIGRQRKGRDEPEITKPVTSELGCVSPVLVVPGSWSASDLRFQAEHVATMKLYNAGCNCMSCQVLILPAEWRESEAFLDAVRRVMDELPERPTGYPGVEERMDAACSVYTDVVERLGESRSRILIRDVPWDSGHQHAFSTEFFGPALAVTWLPGDGTAEGAESFLHRAVDFCNERLAGSLGMSILIHPETTARLGTRFEDAVARLRYGTVGVNAWSALAYHFGGAWGAAPGHHRSDIQSGMGVVRNALLFGRPQKTVLKGSFAPFPRSLRMREWHMSPKPLWFVTNRTAESTTRRLTRYTAAPSLLKLPGIFLDALRG
jgi:aldehyde dehydrogenase (NAD(P)+)